MTFPRLAVSLVAVALFIGPVSAEEQGQPVEGDATIEMTKAILPPAVKAMLLDTRPTEQFTDKELAQRLRLARKFQGLEGLNDDVRIALETAAASAEEEMARRGGVIAEDNQQPAEDLMPIGTQIPEDVLAYVRQPANPSELSDDELKARMDTGREMLTREGWPSDIITALKDQITSYRREMMVRQQTASQQPEVEAESDQAETVQPAPKKTVTAEFTTAEDTAALQIINDRRPAKSMALKQLRDRVKDARRLMKSAKLSPAVKDQLYKKLTTDRGQLRQRMAAATGIEAGEDILQPDSTPETPVTSEIAGDTRSAESLSADELRSRIRSFGAAAASKTTPALERSTFEQRLRNDRRVLRQRMLEERAQRQAKLRKPNKHIVLNAEPAPFDDITAAEANEDELEDILVSAPRRKAQRHYSLDEFERSPELRAAVPRIEVDTIRFGFNESFIREEEIDALDRVAEIVERILASNPYEVFLIEGHTDASGSDAYNLGLSRERARAVVDALTTFYVIPPQNLRAIGYGERYLKIPVPYAEPENRRVSVSRVTDFLAFQ
jgi:outer membrane protein OmpA-like peptidoglycan-associated protein